MQSHDATSSSQLNAARASLGGLLTATVVGYGVDFASGVVLGVAVERGVAAALDGLRTDDV